MDAPTTETTFILAPGTARADVEAAIRAAGWTLGEELMPPHVDPEDPEENSFFHGVTQLVPPDGAPVMYYDGLKTHPSMLFLEVDDAHPMARAVERHFPIMPAAELCRRWEQASSWLERRWVLEALPLLGEAHRALTVDLLRAGLFHPDPQTRSLAQTTADAIQWPETEALLVAQRRLYLAPPIPVPMSATSAHLPFTTLWPIPELDKVLSTATALGWSYLSQDDQPGLGDFGDLLVEEGVPLFHRFKTPEGAVVWLSYPSDPHEAAVVSAQGANGHAAVAALSGLLPCRSPEQLQAAWPTAGRDERMVILSAARHLAGHDPATAYALIREAMFHSDPATRDEARRVAASTCWEAWQAVGEEVLARYPEDDPRVEV